MSNVPYAYNASRLTKVTIKGSVGWWRIYQETGSCHFNTFLIGFVLGDWLSNSDILVRQFKGFNEASDFQVRIGVLAEVLVAGVENHDCDVVVRCVGDYLDQLLVKVCD